MKASAVRATLTLVGCLSLPLLYNACGAVGRSAALGTASLGSGACTASTRAAELRAARPRVRETFAAGKVRLDDAPPTGASRGTEVTYPAGTKLAVIVGGDCLRANAAGFDDSSISRAILSDARFSAVLDEQAIEWSLPRAMTSAELSAAAAADACVIGVGTNHRYQPEALALNDPQRGSQSYLAAAQADAALNLAFGQPGLATTGAKVTVAVLDSGVDYAHPDLASKMAPVIGYDVSNDRPTPTDVSTNGHGTHVAGMIAAASNNGIGISGVMPYRAQILAVRIFATATSTTSSSEIYSGVEYAISQGASVINLSVAEVAAGARTDAVLQQAMQNAVAAGITVVTVIGNAAAGGYLVDGVNTSVLPGRYGTIGGVITVGSINAADGQRSSFSMYGTAFTEIGAVGAESGLNGVLSTIPTALGSYGRLAGTSQAAPQVAAAAALAIAMVRGAYGSAPAPAAIESLILDSADKRGELSSFFKDGNRLNLFNLVQLVRLRYPRTIAGETSGC